MLYGINVLTAKKMTLGVFDCLLQWSQELGPGGGITLPYSVAPWFI